MSSRRKNSNPCMVRTPENLENQENLENKEQSVEEGMGLQTDLELSEKEQSEKSECDDKSVEKQEEEKMEDEKQNGHQLVSEEEGEKENQSPDAVKTQTKEYECKYCEFTTLNLTDFKEHVDSSHPGVILNPVYLCVVCNFRTRKFDSLTEHNEEAHPGDANFKYRRVSEDGHTLLEQSIEESEEVSAETGCISTTVMSPDSLLNTNDANNAREANGPSEQIRAVSINGTVIIPEPNMLQDTSHVSPMLQRPPNFSSVPQIAVPLNTSKYNPSLDDNMTLIASFNRFPYPTHAELSWLTAASKHPEEQIKVWFTTQRLKQGITWSPEEVEEARKKMFNGSIPPNHNTFTVLPTSPVTKPMVHSSPSSKAMVHTTTVEPQRNGTSISSVLNSATHGLKRILNAPSFGPDAKRPIMAVAPNPGEKGLMAPPPLPPPLQKPSDAKRANVNEIKRPVPLMQPPQNPQKNKMVPNVLNNSKTKPLVSMPSIVFPESLTRPMIAPPPIFAPPFKSSILVPRTAKEKAQISLPNGMLTSSAPLIPPQIRRPAIIQTIRGNPNMPPGFGGLEGAPMSEQNGGDTNNVSLNGAWPDPSPQSNGHLEDAKNELQKASVLTQFPLLERMKGKTAEQLKVLEENFLRNSFPSHGEAEALAAATRLSLQEVESWFGERRALRDNLEQALLNSMGTKRHGNGSNGNNGSMLGAADKHNGIKAGGHLGYTLNRVPEEFVSRWSFADDLSQRWFNGKTGSVLPSSDLIGPRSQDLTNGSNGRAQEAELSWFNKNLSAPQHDHFRFRQPSLDLQTGGVFGRWMDRRHDLSEESSG
ncbi:zinc fingers and homeoboxes protein 2 [Periophthalmus magnuspinnatus]|uniref:zinc fingers and homeoboxes protein 2 n=1 Tax=Periophthalmus magnuspinnatus TaxID=409849 RepID=UPI0024370888|nr:zinc fingers and homeoboxes protein 2 [Periophthalmus magnuspinnatus]XP_055081095.1 zinc fingers and homeoboxes protein 2 [Periophthalmus magnuspinnatus]